MYVVMLRIAADTCTTFMHLIHSMLFNLLTPNAWQAISIYNTSLVINFEDFFPTTITWPAMNNSCNTCKVIFLLGFELVFSAFAFHRSDYHKLIS